MAILTVDQLREHVSSELGDDALQRLLDAAEEAIVDRAGAPGARTERVDGGSRFIPLNQPAFSITSLTERWADTTETLAADDYLVWPSGMLIERLRNGTHSASAWRGMVTVVYTPVDQDATRSSVQIDLVRLDLEQHPGLIEETIGEWTERYGSDTNFSEAREAILGRLRAGKQMVVIG